jgi:MoaA/NifB/PqqE/SkfB family radical SAM enzyme/glycosyltransferase involved in cell wall biosynthesis
MSFSITIATREDLFPLVHGGAVKIVRTAEGLSRNGCEVTVVTGDRLRYHRFTDGRHELLDYPPRFIAATRVHPRLRPWLDRLGVPDYWRTIENLLESLGYPKDEHLLYRPLIDPDFWIRTIFVGLKHKTDWFQAEFPGFGAPCWVAARLLRRKCSVVLHNVEWKRLADTTDLSESTVKRLREIELQVCHLADEVITCSADDRELMLPDDFERDEITVIPHGVDLHNYRHKTGAGIREAHGIPPDHALLFFHGTLHYQPNTVACRLFAEEILPRLNERGRKVKVLAAGLSPPDLHQHPDLVYAGCVDDLVSYIAAADVCAVPLLDGGGTRMKILEYFASYKPVVSTAKGAEGLESGSGREIFIVDDHDYEGFCDRVEELLDDPDLAAGMGLLGRRFVERYDWLEVGRAFVELYGDQKGVRGTDFNEAFRERIERDPREVREIGAEIVAKQARALKKIEGKERKNNASRLLQGGRVPQVAHWDEGSISYDVQEEDILRHVPTEIAFTKPRTMILLLNKRCNLKCDFCDLWHFTDLMPYEDALTVLSRAPAAGVRTVVITGGEPFVHPRIYDLIEAGKALGLGINITTNGTLLADHVERLVASRVDSLSISLDGFGQTHDRLRGAEGTYDEVMRAIDALQAGSDIQLNIYFVVTNQNIGDLTRVHDLTVDRGIGFDFWPVNSYPHLYITSDEDQATYMAAVERIARVDEGVADRLDYYRYGLEYMNGRRDHFRCLGLAEQFAVNHEGKLVPCCVWDVEGLQVGSALERPLDELLYSDEAQRLREQIFAEGCVDQCFNHSLYEFQLATDLPFVVKPAVEPLRADKANLKTSGQVRGRARRGRGRRVKAD